MSKFPPVTLWLSLAFAATNVTGWSAAATAQSAAEFNTPTAISTPIGIAAGPDGALWFTEVDGNNIGRIATDGAVTEFPLPTSGAGPDGITVGPDGALWFTENTAAQIGRITTSGTITEFPLPPPVGTAPLAPSSITAGPDGALWFTIGRPLIGRITTSGTVTEFSTTDSSMTELGAGRFIVSGPDGNLWIHSGTTIVGRMTPAGVITNFTNPITGTIPSGPFVGGFAAGPDGALWFTEQIPGGNNRIGRITTGGVFSDFTLPSTASTSAPGAITTGPDGALWFFDNPNGVGTLGRITTSGVLTEFSLSKAAGGGAPSMVTGPDGAIWFTLQAANQIGQFILHGSNLAAVTLVSAVLPSSRSVQVGTAATAFATMINTDVNTATSCGLVPVSTVPASFVFQTTDPSTNALTGSANTPVNIPAGQAQSFVVAFTPNAPFVPTDIALGFSCANENAASINSGLNTLLLSGSTSPVPDIVALAASGDPGIVDIPGSAGTGAFAVATVNVGASAAITASADTGAATLPVTVTLCQTNPATGACISPTGPNVTTTINANQTPTFAIFVAGNGTVPFSPADKRIFVRFKDSGGVTRGSTSVAVRTQ